MKDDSCLEPEGIGTQNWNTNGRSADFVCHESVPQEGGSVSGPKPAGTDGTHGTQNNTEVDGTSDDKNWEEVL
jgi:hypothetical protein